MLSRVVRLRPRMRFLVDNALLPLWCKRVMMHVTYERLTCSAQNAVILDQAAGEDRIVVSADTDFGALGRP